MKKLLLTITGLVLAMGAGAKTYQETFPAATPTNELIDAGFTDVTPTYYKFDSLEAGFDFSNLGRADLRPDAQTQFYKQANIDGSFIKNNTNQGGSYFTTENLKKGNILFGGWEWANPANIPTFLKNLNLYDFGGKLGQVLIINGKESELGEKIAEIFKVNAPELKNMYSPVNNNSFVISWILNHLDMRDKLLSNDNKVRVRMEVNFFHNDMPDKSVCLNTFRIQNDLAAQFGPADGSIKINYKDFSKRVGDSAESSDGYDSTETSEWNPYRWMVVEFDTKLNESQDVQNGYYIRQNIQGADSDRDHAAILIKNIEILLAPDNYDGNEDLNVARLSWKDYTPEPDPETGDNYSQFIDITPAYYKFNTSDVSLREMINPEVKFSNAFNLGGGEISSNLDDNGKGWFTTEGLQNGYLSFGGWIMNNNAVVSIAKGMSICDFGGKIGKVLVINGSSSKLDEAIKDSYGLTDVPQMRKAEASPANNVVMYFLVNHKNSDLIKNNDKKLRLRMEINTYNELTTTNALTSIKLFNEAGNNFGETVAINNAGFTDESGKWDPEKWMVYEIDFAPANIAQAEGIKLDLTTMNAGDNFNTGAIIIRNFELYIADETKLEPNKANVSYITLEKGSEFKAPYYDDITAINLTHDQEDTLQLSAGEKSEISLNIVTKDWSSYDPTTSFSVEVNKDAGNHVTATEIEEGIFEVAISDSANRNDVEISVKSGDVESNKIVLEHYALPTKVELSNNDIEISEENIISMKDNMPGASFTVKMNEGAYQKFMLTVGESNVLETIAADDEVATIEMNEDGDAIVITPKKAGDITFVVNPYLAGEHKKGLDATDQGKTEFKVSVGTTGVKLLNVTTGETEYYDLQGRKVKNPGNGIYIKKDGDKTVKVLL